MYIPFRRLRECSALMDCARFQASPKGLLDTVWFSRSVIFGGEGIDRLEFSLVRQEDRKSCATEGIGGAGADAQATAVLLDEFAGDPKAEACAGIFFRGEERFEDAFKMLGWNAETGICDGDAYAKA